MDLRLDVVRFADTVGCYSDLPGDGWSSRDRDHHSLLKEELPLRAREVHPASAALITDLKELGMYDEKLIVWSG